MTLNTQEAILTAGNIKEQQQRRELYEALVTECDFPELLAETVAVLADPGVLTYSVAPARRGDSLAVITEFANWYGIELRTGIPDYYWLHLSVELREQQNKNIPNNKAQGVDTPDQL